jgi:hypothetical protein
MRDQEFLNLIEAYASIYEKKESEMESGEKGESEKGKSEKDEGGKHKEGKHPKGKEEKGEKVTEKEGKETEKEMKESADLFDYILEHLVAEGYADTNKAALAIMANMSEEWKQSIVEGATGAYVPNRVDIFNKRQQDLRNRGQDVGPNIPGPSGGGQYPEPGAGKPGVLKLARGTSSSNRGVESKNNA